MTSTPSEHADALDEAVARVLYQRLLDRWNIGDARGMAELFTEDGSVIGFDGSPMNGRAEIAATLHDIFAQHQTASYVGLVREVRPLTEDVELLRAVAGMTPPGSAEINPAVNAIQTLITVRHAGEWRIALFQNTPAAFHGRPELSQALTRELQQAHRAQSPPWKEEP